MTETVFSAQILILLYVIITFGYSAIEKLWLKKETLVFYKNHFKETFLKNRMPFLINLVILLEIATVIICIAGLFYWLVFRENNIGFYGLVLASLTLIALMIGQRIAKDYAGAMHITVYFILTVFGVFLLQ